MPFLSACRSATDQIRTIMAPTPLVPLRIGCAPEGQLLKLETFTPVSSFKLRGVYHAVVSLAPQARAGGLLTVSAGNTAQALAWCGCHFGVDARCIMPETAPRSKIVAVEQLGGTADLRPRDEVFRFLNDHRWEQEPEAFIHPWTNPHVHCGHGSMALEIAEQCPEVKSVMVPVGGGGLLGGVGQALRAIRPDVRIIAVEPEGCPSLHAAVKAGGPVTVECATECDGVAVPFITDEMFLLLRDLADDHVLVSEASVRETVGRLAIEQKLVVEPSGALAVAAAIELGESAPMPGVALVTGGSIDGVRLAEILQSGVTSP